MPRLKGSESCHIGGEGIWKQSAPLGLLHAYGALGSSVTDGEVAPEAEDDVMGSILS